VRDGSGVRDWAGLGDRVGFGFGVGVGPSDGVAVTHGSQVGFGFGVGAVDLGVVGAGEGLSSGNFGPANRYLFGSSFSSATDFSMNCRQIGPGPLAP
jgi:hypothetical protein